MQTALCLRRGLLTPHPGVCSWGPCYLRILKGSKAQGNCKAHVFPSAEEGKCSDRSGFLREGGASPAAIGTDCSPTDSGPGKKKKPAAVSTGPVVVCCGVLQHSLAASRVSLFLRLVPGHVTWPHGTADLTTRFLLFPQLVGSSRSAFFLLMLSSLSSHPPLPHSEFLFFLFHIHQSGKHHLFILF